MIGSFKTQLLWHNSPTRKDKCSLMWRMVGCGFLPTGKTDPWNIVEINLESIDWLIGPPCKEDFKCDCNNCQVFPIFFQFTLLLKEQPFSWLKQVVLPLLFFLSRGWIWRKYFSWKLVLFCAIILHHELWSPPIMILSFCIWIHANMNTTYIPGYHLTDISYIS